MAVALIALAIALGGTSYAAVVLPAGSVGTAQLKNNAVTASKVKNGSLTKKDFASGALLTGPAGPQGPPGPAGPQGPAASIADGSSGTSKIVGNAGQVDVDLPSIAAQSCMVQLVLIPNVTLTGSEPIVVNPTGTCRTASS